MRKCVHSGTTFVSRDLRECFSSCILSLNMIWFFDATLVFQVGLIQVGQIRHVQNKKSGSRSIWFYSLCSTSLWYAQTGKFGRSKFSGAAVSLVLQSCSEAFRGRWIRLKLRTILMSPPHFSDQEKWWCPIKILFFSSNFSRLYSMALVGSFCKTAPHFSFWKFYFPLWASSRRYFLSNPKKIIISYLCSLLPVSREALNSGRKDSFNFPLWGHHRR